ncbi:thiamine biosynthesis protein ThiF [bacterium]|nr:thiamine biosynthesis protein ThiF [bacterium]MBU1990755.1 thiamine biosynthesis protein ThiF [bacterium]
MIHGFDLNNPLVCEGIVGEGCGGGRIFLIENSVLKAYDPQSQEYILLLENIHMPKKISKKACIISIECEKENIEFDLSSMGKSIKKV